VYRREPRNAREVRGLDQRGFTLIEILVALTVGAVVVLLAHELFVP